VPDIAAPPDLTHRDRKLLAAVAAGRVELTCGDAPDTYVDGVVWCDQFGARTLFRAGLILGKRSGLRGERVVAQLTDMGQRVLA
jgi:hypothetical protein